jgi:hypothetical protein
MRYRWFESISLHRRVRGSRATVPELRGRPVVVLSNNDGCVIARSNEAKALGYRYKKAGVGLLDLHPAAAAQAELFDKPDSARCVTLTRTVDRLNTRFGRDTVAFAAAGRRPWKLRREFLSPRYTTAWDELLRV